MTTKLPLTMLKGRVVTAIRAVPSITRIHYTDGTYSELLRPGDDEYLNKMTELEHQFNEHVHTAVPAAHTGQDTGNSVILGAFQAVFRVVPTPPAIIGMAQNTEQSAVSEVFRVELELINKTGNRYTDISFTIPAPVNLHFFDETAECTMVASNGVRGLSASHLQQHGGYELGPGESGTFSVLAQQTLGNKLLTTASFAVQLLDLEYRVQGAGSVTNHPSLPISASYLIAP